MAKTLLLFFGGLVLIMDSSIGQRVNRTYPSYPSYPTGSYPSYPTGRYPSYPTGRYPNYPTGRYPTYPTGNYPTYPTGGRNNTNTCASNPCLNGARCYSYGSYKYGGWSCSCKPGYSGPVCQYSVSDPCKKSENVCANNGICNAKKSYYWRSVRYELACICPKTHTGPTCLKKNPCFEGPCQNGICTPMDNGTTNAIKCHCNSGFEGKNCDIPTPNLCNANTCKNNGICHQYLNHSLGISQHKCYCKNSWGGKDCSEDMSNPCQSSPCENEGVCTNGNKGKYFCTCKAGFAGQNCEHADPCTAQFCGDHGRCLAIASYDMKKNATELKAVCECDPSHAGLRCEIVNPCISENPCEHGGQCNSYPKRSYHYYFVSRGNYNSTGFTSPKCYCPQYFGGKRCEVVSPCIEKNPCQNEGVCKDNVKYSYDNGTSYKEFLEPRCYCPADYTGKYCETKIVNPCEDEPCKNGGLCSKSKTDESAFVCTCIGNYIGETCEIKNTKITECSFEKGLCSGFTTTKTGSFAWIIQSGSTRSVRTGPSTGKDGKYYIYTEASSPARSGYKAYIRSKYFETESTSCVSLNYHMYGSAIGTLKVKTENSEREMTSDKEFSLSGDQSNKWHSLSLTVQPGSSRLVIEATRGNSWAGDIAVDNIVWVGRACDEEGEGEGGENPDNGEPDK
ncbi:DgyrCDS3242 [Dimorphilus gyrociliatus]|uniref:DgyrCDS3242 n=1 Tax=Dimorphilus gyrociliatus TaxID=2664684 RepID=A0A7I8VD20_9ANNE|nr:DgyrCDS3242 [Dimorphilus gyrociliatus]